MCACYMPATSVRVALAVRVALLLSLAGATATRLVELPALRRSIAPDDQPYAVASLLAGGGELLNGIFGTSFFDSPDLLADLCCPLGPAPAPALLLLAPASTSDAASELGGQLRRMPLPALAMSDVWLVPLPSEGGGTCPHAVAVCDALVEALASLGATGAPPRQLALLVSFPESARPLSDKAAAAAASAAAARCVERLRGQLEARAGAGAGAPLFEASHVAVPCGAGADAAARRLLSMLLQPSSQEYLLRSRGAFGTAALPVAAVPRLLRTLLRGDRSARSGAAAPLADRQEEALQRPLPATPAEWEGLLRCEAGAEAARAEAEATCAALRERQSDESLNPSRHFGRELDGMFAACLARFEDAAAPAGARTDALAGTERSLRRLLAAASLRLAKSHLAALRAAAFDEFCGDLVERMHAARRYMPAARRLRKAHARRFRAAVRSALPSCGEARRAAERLAARAQAAFDAQMAAEVQLRSEEGAELEAHCPLPADDKPAPWYRQVYVQLVGIAFNAAQFYLLQYLPAKRKNLAHERQMPRGPLF